MRIRTRNGRLAALIAAAILFWSLFITICVTYHVVPRGRSYQWEMIGFDGVLIGLGALSSVMLTLLLRRFDSHGFARQAIGAALIIAALAPPFELTSRFLYRWHGKGPDLPELGLVQLWATSLYWLAPLCLWTAGVLALLHDRRARIRERQAIQARAEAHEAQVRALRYQINPHFLYNTLNSVSSLIMDNRNAEADAMVLELAAFFRASLSVDPLVDVPLKDEIEHQLLYLGIEQVRFADRVKVTVDLPPPLEKAGVPSFILQPLVENAMKHGLRGAGRRLHLQMAASADADRLTIEVEDDGAGVAALGGTGTGLVNVERRLKTRYGDQAALIAGPGDGGFKVRLTMPLQLCA